METVKLIIAHLLSPLSIALLVMLAGWIAKLRHRDSTAWLAFASATVILIFGSLSGFVYPKLRANEFQYAPLELPNDELTAYEPLTIIVLGAGFNDDDYLPANSRVSNAFLARLIEGVRVYRNFKNSQLVISVAGKADVAKKKIFIENMIQILELDPSRVHLIDNALSTADEAAAIKADYPTEQIVVVSSAGHLPRAMDIFQDLELSVVAAPTDYGFTRAGSPSDKPWQRWIPSAGGIGANQQFLYETVAGLWHDVSGK